MSNIPVDDINDNKVDDVEKKEDFVVENQDETANMTEDSPVEIKQDVESSIPESSPVEIKQDETASNTESSALKEVESSSLTEQEIKTRSDKMYNLKLELDSLLIDFYKSVVKDRWNGDREPKLNDPSYLLKVVNSITQEIINKFSKV